MYYAHFGLKEPPFKITPNTDFFYSGANRGAILEALLYAISSGEGIIKVVGEVGSGKTMICRMLQTMLPKNVESVYLANPSVAPEDVLHAIAFELQLKLPKDADRLNVMHELQQYLLKRHAQRKQVVIFVEEAQGMPIETLEEIRLLSNLETRQDKLLQIVLFGQPELDQNLDDNKIRQLRERITHSFYLAPFGKDDISHYIDFRLRKAGYNGPPPFTESALKLISSASAGLVRRANILADKALLATFSQNAYQVTDTHVMAAIKDSEFGRGFSAQSSVLDYLKPYLKPVALAGLCILALAAVAYYFPQWQAARQTPATPVATAPAAPQKQAKPIKPAVKKPKQTAPKPAPILAPGAVVLEDNDHQLLQEKLEATQTWLASEPPETFTIQIMSATSEADLLRQLQQAPALDLSEVRIYRSTVNGTPIISAVYGSYADKDSVHAAMAALPEEIKLNSPLIRTAAGIRRQAR